MQEGPALSPHDAGHPLTRRLASFGGRVVMLGFGCIGQGVLPLLMRHLGLAPQQVLALSATGAGRAVAQAHGVAWRAQPVTPASLHEEVGRLLAPGDFLLNLSVGVSSAALLALCRDRGALYLDTCVEPWAGGHTDHQLAPAQRTNYALREAALALRAQWREGPTAVLAHGANPGLISHFLKRALLAVAAAGRPPGGPAPAAPVQVPDSREGWARLAQALGVRTIHVAERDTQFPRRPKRPGEFVNTWSVEGFVGEARQPAELGWGTHERQLPPDARRHERGCGSAIYLLRPGAATRVRSWTPLCGPQHGFLVTHAESISIADHLTLGDPARPDYRPTVHYAYHPCDGAVLSLHELAGRNWEPQPQPQRRVLTDELMGGVDELGVLLMGPARGAYWYGSRLGLAQARALAPHNNATSLQVTAAVLAGVVWAIRHPQQGIVEPDELPHDEILDIARPYLGQVWGEWTGWTPLQGRNRLFPEPLDLDDPWQFVNVRVA